MWYSSSNITFEPELSYKSAVYGPALPDYNTYMGRLQRILQEGRHVVRYQLGDGSTVRFYYVKSGATRALRVITRPGGFVDAR